MCYHCRHENTGGSIKSNGEKKLECYQYECNFVGREDIDNENKIQKSMLRPWLLQNTPCMLY